MRERVNGSHRETTGGGTSGVVRRSESHGSWTKGHVRSPSRRNGGVGGAELRVTEISPTGVGTPGERGRLTRQCKCRSSGFSRTSVGTQQLSDIVVATRTGESFLQLNNLSSCSRTERQYRRSTDSDTVCLLSTTTYPTTYSESFSPTCLKVFVY